MRSRPKLPPFASAWLAGWRNAVPKGNDIQTTPVAAADVVPQLRMIAGHPGAISREHANEVMLEAAAEITRLREKVAELRAKLDRARPLVALLTVRQVIQGGDDVIAASGLNPWCINEGRATGDEPISAWWLE